MRLEQSDAEQRFTAEVGAFLDAHWRGRDRQGSARDFHAALAARGWSVPRWPVAHGGREWPPWQAYLFDRLLAAAGAPLPDPLGVEVVGPVLLAAGSPGGQAAHLPPIREGRERWCAHASVFGGPRIRVRRTGSGVALDGTSLLAWQAREAQWLLAVAELSDGAAALLAWPLDARAVEAGLPLDPDRVHLAGATGQVLTPFAALEPVLERRRRQPRSHAARLTRSLGETRALLEKAGVADDGALELRLSALEIDCRGLEGTEVRAAAALGKDEDRAAALFAGLRLRAAAVAEEIAGLALAALGYHALPAVDPHLSDNERPLGPGGGPDAIGGLFGYVGALDAMAERDRIARLVGFPGARDT